MKDIKILLVEDQRLNAMTLQLELEKMGYTITDIIECGEEAINSIEKEMPNLILMDIVLNGQIDGIDTAKNIQERFDIPIIYLTAFADEEIFERVVSTCPTGYLVKPFEAIELSTTIKSSLYIHEKEMELKYCKENFDKAVEKKAMQLSITKAGSETNKALSAHVKEHIRKLHRVVEQSPSIILITDPKGNIEYVNPTFTKLTGYTIDEIVGKNPRLLKSNKQSNEFYKNLWDTIKSGNDWHGELCNVKKGGDYYWESVSISPLANPEGVITNYVKASEDITKRKLIEKELKKNHDELEDRVKMRTAELASANKKLHLEITARKVSEKKQEKLINELHETILKVKTLSGLIPICSSCKKIRDDKGFWSQVEMYIKEHSYAEFTHSICPDCKDKLLNSVHDGN